MKKVNCFQCKHFHTTWNPKFPRACKAYGFKTKEMPSALVLKTTGTECMQFEPKHQATSQKQRSKTSRFDFRM